MKGADYIDYHYWQIKLKMNNKDIIFIYRNYQLFFNSSKLGAFCDLKVSIVLRLNTFHNSHTMVDQWYIYDDGLYK